MRRSPHGERGLKYHDLLWRRISDRMSLSSRRAWIEILVFVKLFHSLQSRSPHGERGLKLFCLIIHLQSASGRSPHGERGLKFKQVDTLFNRPASLSSRRAWIEIRSSRKIEDAISRSLSSRRAWIEISTVINPFRVYISRSPHGERGLKCLEQQILIDY